MEKAEPTVSIMCNKKAAAHLAMTNTVQAATRSVDRLIGHFQMKPVDAREVRAACAALHTLNPRGAWCMSPVPEAALVIEETHIGGEALHDYLKVAMESLQDLLPTTRVIRTEAHLQGDPNGKVRRRAWVRFLSSPDTEAAALDTAVIATHIRDAIVPGEHRFNLANQVRLQAWATQLGAKPQDMPELLHFVSLCAVNLQSTEVRLRAN
jgi:hypothetical protein